MLGPGQPGRAIRMILAEFTDWLGDSSLLSPREEAMVGGQEAAAGQT